MGRFFPLINHVWLITEIIMTTDWIYGKHAIQEALLSDREVHKILLATGLQKKSITKLYEQMVSLKIPFQWVPRSRLDQLVSGANHQGIVAQVAVYPYSSLEDCYQRAKTKNEPPFFLLLDGIEDPHNLGSILRTADASGVHGVVIPKRRAVGITSVVAKTSAGAIEHIPVVRTTNLNRIADELKKEGLWIVGSDGSASESYRDVDYKLPIALVIGNEGAGISNALKKRCDFLVQLPMLGKVSSLNASVAAGILMYEVVRCRCRA